MKFLYMISTWDYEKEEGIITNSFKKSPVYSPTESSEYSTNWIQLAVWAKQ